MARWALVEAAWTASKSPGSLHAFAQRVGARRGRNIAAVAVARKLAVLAWHLLSKNQDYAFARPSLVATKVRKIELTAGAPAARGVRGTTHDWKAPRPSGKKKGAGATTGARIH